MIKSPPLPNQCVVAEESILYREWTPGSHFMHWRQILVSLSAVPQTTQAIQLSPCSEGVVRSYAGSPAISRSAFFI